MSNKPSPWRSAIALAAAFVALPAWSLLRPAGAEFRVNASSEQKQYNPHGAVAPGGRTLLVWENANLGLRGRFYNPDGTPATAEISLVPNQRLTGIQTRGIEAIRTDPFVAFLPSGEFLLAWTEERDDVSLDILERREILDKDVHIQRFTANGQRIGQAARVNPAGPGFQSYPRVLVRGNQPALVVWQSDDRTQSDTQDGVFLRYVTKAGGRPFGETFKVSLLPGLAGRPAVAGLPSGRFMVVWHQDDGQGLGVYARAFRLTPQGAPDPASIQVRVNSSIGGDQARPAVAARGNSDYLVVWQGPGATSNEAHVFARSVSPAGEPAAKIVQVSQKAGNIQISPSIAYLRSGGFLVTWLDWFGNAPLGVFGQLLDGQGNLSGAELKISDQPISAHFRTTIAAGPATIVVPYEAYFNQVSGITARRLVP